MIKGWGKDKKKGTFRLPSKFLSENILLNNHFERSGLSCRHELQGVKP